MKAKLWGADHATGAPVYIKEIDEGRPPPMEMYEAGRVFRFVAVGGGRDYRSMAGDKWHEQLPQTAHYLERPAA